jgi:hypothetical protein
MYKPIIFLFLVCLVFSSCTPSSGFAPTRTGYPQAFATPTIVRGLQEISTQGPSSTPKPTDTWQPTLTILPTTEPSVLPNSDLQIIVTATLAPKADCPRVSSTPDPNLGFPDYSYQTVVADLQAFLNQYGAQALYKAAKAINFNHDPRLAKDLSDTILQDLTNDEEPEIAIRPTSFFIFGCRAGQYIKLFELKPDGYDHAPNIVTIQDTNHNGIPELTMFLREMSQGGHSFGIFEWNGEKFTSLIALNQPFDFDYGSIWVEATGKIHYEDVDHDLMQELIVDSGIPIWETYVSNLPWRNERSIYKWNGTIYTVVHRAFDPPEFRFQAIQDGDLAVSQQEYAKAMDLYQQAIFKSELKDYSPEIRQNLQENWYGQNVTNKLVTSTPVPPDPTEYPHLAAYAYYRMVILHAFLGEMDAAQVKYVTLQEKFPTNSPGHAYAEMASAFWDTYRVAGRMVDACDAAIHYAAEHPEILTPLGSDYHGEQSYKYVPGDMLCPFK